MNKDIKTGTILMVGDSSAVLPTLIKLFEGSKWHHAGLILEINGELVVWEEKTFWGLGLTKLSEYVKKEKAGLCKLAFANLKTFNTESKKKEIVDLCQSLISEHPYNVWTILRETVRLPLKRIFNYDWKFKSKNGFVCSGAVEYVLNEQFKCFPNWGCDAPVDLIRSNLIYFIYED